MTTINVRRAAIFAAVLLLVAPATLTAQSSAPDWSTASHRILPFVIGDGWTTSFTVVNNGERIQTDFVWRSLAGEHVDLTAWHTDGRFAGTNPAMTIGMPAKSTGKMNLTAQEMVLGWMDHSILPGPNGEPSTSASATIRRDGAMGEATFAGIIPAKAFLFPMDQLGGARMSLVLVNPSTRGVKANVAVRNCDGGDLGTREASLPASGGIATMLSAELGQCGVGSVDIIADGEIAVFAFKLNADGSFSSVLPAGRPQQQQQQ